MPSLSSFALAFLTRSDCLLAYSGLRFPSSTYFMATSTSCGSFCAKTIQLYAFWGPAPMRFALATRITTPGRSRLCCGGALERDWHKAAGQTLMADGRFQGEADVRYGF